MRRRERVVSANKCGYTIADEGRRGVFWQSAESLRDVAAGEHGKLRSPSLGLHNLQANDKTGFCVIKRLFVFDILPMVFREFMDSNKQPGTMYEYREKRTLLVLLLGTLCSVFMVYEIYEISCYRYMQYQSRCLVSCAHSYQCITDHLFHAPRINSVSMITL